MGQLEMTVGLRGDLGRYRRYGEGLSDLFGRVTQKVKNLSANARDPSLIPV